MKNNYVLMAEIFRFYRLFNGYSKRELAKLVGISHTELSRIEHCERENYNIVTLINMCRVLHIDFIKLLKMCGYLPCKKGEIDEDILEYIDKVYNKENKSNAKDEICYVVAFFNEDTFKVGKKR